MPDSKFANERLAYYLTNENMEQYSKLIEYVMKDEAPIAVKYNLMCLLMNHGTQNLTIANLADRLRNLYCSDESIQKYLDETVVFNPKLGYVSISAKSGRDMEDDCSKDIHLKVPYDADVDKYFENARRLIANAREVLTMMFLETKTVAP